ncbi:MAG TPA: 4'-phosphopantetheinyl transferase superfamily protein [Bacilli bacterium]
MEHIIIGAVRRVPTLPEYVFNNLMNKIEETKQKKICAYRQQADKERSILGDILIRIMLFNHFGWVDTGQPFAINQYGKPSLIGRTEMQFNLSHSGDWIVCAVSSNPIGIDVEKINVVDLSIANRFFSKEEQTALFSRSEEEKLPYFYELWTLKESYIKAIGKGLSEPLNQFTIHTDSNGIKLVTDRSNTNWQFRQYNLDPEYKLSVCTVKNSFPDYIREFHWTELYDFLTMYH